MELFNYTYNSGIDIINLKKNLMKSDNFSSASSKNENISSIVKEKINTDLGPIFEENVRGIMENHFHFKKVIFPKTNFYKIITIQGCNSVKIIQNKGKEIKFKNNLYQFLFNDDFSLSYRDSKNKKWQIIEKEKSAIKSNITLNGKNISVSPTKEIEIDGFYQINNFKVELFDEKEVNIIFNNINKEEEIEFQYALLEVKLSKKKVGELALQLKKDHAFVKLLEKQAIFLGFINDKSVDSKEYKKYLKGIPCVIYGVQNSIFCKRNVVHQYDWLLISEFKYFKNQFDELLEKVNGIVNYIEEEKKRKEKKKLLGKKKERKESNTDDLGDE